MNLKKTQVKIFLVFLTANVLSLFLFNRFIGPHGYEYETIARNLLNGFGYSGKFLGGTKIEPTAFMAPIYPYLLFLHFKFLGPSSYLLIQLLQSISLAFVPVLAYFIWKNTFDSKGVAIFSTILLLLNFPFTLFSGYIGVPAFLTLGMTLLIFLFMKSEDKASLRYSVVLGMVAGVLVLLDPIILIPFGCGLLWYLVVLRSKKLFLYGLFALFCASIVSSPWMIRNYLVFDRFPVIKSAFGTNLLEGNSPIATGGLFTREGEIMNVKIMELIPDSIKGDFGELHELERAEILQSLAIQYIKKSLTEDPLGYLRLKMNAALYFWFGQSWRISDHYGKYLEARGVRPPMVFFFTMMFIFSLLLLTTAFLGVIRAIVKKREKKEIWILLLLFLLYPLVYIVTKGHSFVRFRLPLDPFLVGFSSYFLFGIFKKGKVD